MFFSVSVCNTLDEIKSRLSKLLDKSLNFSIEGKGQDYVIEFSNVTTDSIIDEIIELFSDSIYGFGEQKLAETLVELLYEKALNIACAESITGGMISSAIVGVSGSSQVFHEGIVSYSNISKLDRLNVGEDTLIDYGAVSQEVAIEMANGLLGEEISISVSTTGIAGPTGESDFKPIGLTFISVVSEKHSDCFKYIFVGDRNSIREQAKDVALFKAIEHIQKFY